MALPPDFLEEIKQRVPLSGLVSRKVALKKAGREWKGLSPFTKEKSPSFFVNDQKAFWHCFSSNRSGDHFRFLMETEGVSFPEAVERVAEMAGVPVPKASPEAAAQAKKRASLVEVVDMAATFFEQTLASRDGAKARGYLTERRIAPQTQAQFRMGYAPAGRFALKEALGRNGVPVEDMVETGLLIAGDDIPLPYDRFRDRVMFPITDMRGKIIAFGGRALEKGVPAKYLNSPETTLFHKGATLYNGASARTAALNGATVIAVEGYVDVVALVAAGFPAAVAPLGTAMTDAQLGLVWGMTDEPVLLFDGDRAGRKAAYRMVDLGLSKLAPGKSLRFGLLPEGQDPDDLIRAAGPAAMQDVLSTTVGLADMLWRRETEGQTFDTPEKRAALETRLREVVRAVPAETVRRHYEDDITRRLREAFAGAAGGRPARPGRPGSGFRPRPGGPGGYRDARDQPLAPAGAALIESALVRGPRAAVPRAEALILELLLNHPWLIAERMEEIAELDLRHPEAARLASALPALVDADATLTRTDLEDALAAQGHGALLARITGPLGASGRAPTGAAVHTRSVWGAGKDAAPDDVRQTFHQMVTLHRSRSTLLNELKEAEKALAEAGDEAAFAWLVDVKNRLAVVEGTEALVDGFGAASGRRNERG